MQINTSIKVFPQPKPSAVLNSAKCVLLCLILSLWVNPATAQELDPTLPPSGNFDLSYWKLTRPNQQELDEDALTSGTTIPGEFYTDPVTGAMVFWCPNNGRTGGSTYPRNELREMIRRGDTSIGTQGINKNNWVFSSSTRANQEAAGGVDGIMTATVAVDHVSETSDQSFKVGRTIVGQIHASDDEPCRLYYRKLPNNTRGSIYFAHEPTTGSEQWYEMIGSRSDGAPDPVDGIALGEKFSYEIKVIGDELTVKIMREGKPDVVQVVDMTNSGFANDWMYFKAGNYNQNNAGAAGEYAQVSFFALDVVHFEPTTPTQYLFPSEIPRFQSFLAECKLQAPTSSTLRDQDALNSGYAHPEWFKVVDGDKILFNQTGDSRRTELRDLENWNLNDENRSLHGRIDIVEQTCEQVTVMQIHDDANAGDGPNKPLLRIYKHNGRFPTNHIWAAIKTNDGGVATTHVDLGEDPGGYFNCDIRLVDGRMIIDYEREEKVNMDVSYWIWPSYWKAGVYLQDSGEATAHFDQLFEEDGASRNLRPSVTLTAPATGTEFMPGDDITITADADDSDGSVALVEFFEGSNKIGEDDTAPYEFTWEQVRAGVYALSARATDDVGAVRTSANANIRVGSTSSVVNWALDRPVVGTGTPDGANVPSNLVDDDPVSRWSVETFPQSATIDLGQAISISSTELVCYQDRAYQYTIEGAMSENGPYTTIVDRSGNTTAGTADLPITDFIDDTSARYVRITVTGASGYTGPWVSLTELRVFGQRTTSLTNPPGVSITIAPNPATSLLTIAGAEDYEQVTVYDLSGRKVLQKVLNQSDSLDVSWLPPGAYTLLFEGRTAPYVTKLIKR